MISGRWEICLLSQGEFYPEMYKTWNLFQKWIGQILDQKNEFNRQRASWTCLKTLNDFDNS